MADPIVSVVIPVYREKGLLIDAIESVLSQSFKHFEIILVDNNSDQESLNILHRYHKKYPSVIRLLKETKQGAPSARNKGITESRGQYIAMLEGDDLMYPTRLDEQYCYFREHASGVSLLSSSFDLVEWNNTVVLKKGKTDCKHWMKSLCFEDLFYTHPSTWFFKRETAISAGLFNEGFNPRLLEDDEFILRMYFVGKLRCLDSTLVRVRLPSHEYNKVKMSQVSSIALLNKYELFFNILKEKTVQKGIVGQNHKGFSEIRSRWLRERGLDFLPFKNGLSVAKKFLLEAIKESPFDYGNLKWLIRLIFMPSYYKKKAGEISDDSCELNEEELQYLLGKTFFN